MILNQSIKTNGVSELESSRYSKNNSQKMLNLSNEEISKTMRPSSGVKVKANDSTEIRPRTMTTTSYIDKDNKSGPQPLRTSFFKRLQIPFPAERNEKSISGIPLIYRIYYIHYKESRILTLNTLHDRYKNFHICYFCR